MSRAAPRRGHHQHSRSSFGHLDSFYTLPHCPLFSLPTCTKSRRYWKLQMLYIYRRAQSLGYFREIPWGTCVESYLYYKVAKKRWKWLGKKKKSSEQTKESLGLLQGPDKSHTNPSCAAEPPHCLTTSLCTRHQVTYPHFSTLLPNTTSHLPCMQEQKAATCVSSAILQNWHLFVITF